MKILQSQRRLLLYCVTFSLIVSTFLLLHFMPQIHWAYRLYWVMLIPISIILVTPLGHKKLSTTMTEKPRYSAGVWLLSIVTLELTTLIIFWGVCQLSGVILPIFTAPTHVFAPSLTQTLHQLGLFPFTEIAVLACALGYYGYQRQEDGYLSTLFHPFFRSRVDNAIGMILNTSARAATMLALSSTLAFTVLLILSACFSTSLMAGFNVFSILVYVLLLLVASNKFIKKSIHWLTVQYRLHPFTALLFIVVLLVVSLTLLNLFFHGFYHENFHPPYLMQLLLKQSWATHWSLFMTVWWLLWIPLLAIFIARLSQGYSYRSVVAGTLLLPVIMAVGLSWPPFYHALDRLNALSPAVTALLVTLSVIVLLMMIARKNSFLSVMQAYFPTPTVSKFRSPDRFLGTILQFSTLIVCIYLVTGIVLLNVLFFIFLWGLSVALVFLPLMILETWRAP